MAMARRVMLCGAVIAAALAGAAAAAQGPDQWSVTCQDTEAGRECSLTVAVSFRARKGVANPVVANWTIINRPMAIEEALQVRIDPQALPGYRVLGINDKERHAMIPAAPPAAELPATPLRDALLDGHELTVVLIDDATGRQSTARLPSVGFEAARDAMFAEIAKGANRQ
jgi:hypothetical protein